MSYDEMVEWLANLRTWGASLDRRLETGELTKDAWWAERKPLLIRQRELEARLQTASIATTEVVEPDHRRRPAPGRPVRPAGGVSAVGRFLAALVTGLAAGIPILASIAVESAVIVGGVAWFLGDSWRWDGVEVFWWVFGVQAGLVALFAVPGVVVHAVRIARQGWDAIE